MSTALVRRSPAQIERHFGPFPRWCRDGALIGAWTGAAATLVPLLFPLNASMLESLQLLWSFEVFRMAVLEHLIWSVGIGAVTGTLLLGSAPTVLDRLRGRVPLAVIGVAVPIASAALVTPLVLWSSHPLELAWTLRFAGAITALQAGLFWLPYTMASMLGSGRRWVVAGGLASAPLVVALVTMLMGFV